MPCPTLLRHAPAFAHSRERPVRARDTVDPRVRQKCGEPRGRPASTLINAVLNLPVMRAGCSADPLCFPAREMYIEKGDMSRVKSDLREERVIRFARNPDSLARRIKRPR